ncbi:MAG TPA: FxLYD domain-containing protein [Candidatus Nitrosotalea sp.]|nr:FxLYD domain-containing protein [Candidatus Nitrosotalea sp.]
MKIIYYILPVVILAFFFNSAYADVYVADKEFAGHFDSNGAYTVYGAVKNTGNQPVLAKVQVTVLDGNSTFSESRILPVIYSLADMPFKFKFPQITDGHPVLERPAVTFLSTNSNPLDIVINYDKSLVKYPDGHLTGFITNTGKETVNNIDIYALVHDRDNNYLDEVENTWTIPSLSGGNKTEFVMYPDPSVAKEVYYYSCFIPGTDNSIELSTPMNGKTFYFSVLSIVYFTNPRLSGDNTSLSLEAANPWQIPYYANFMFPRDSGNGSFDVLIDGAKVNALNSFDNDTRNWHVAFNVPYGQHKVVISGFEPGYIPDNDEYFYLDAKSALTSWAGFSTFTIPDAKLLEVIGVQGHHIPSWVKTSVGYMIYNNVPSDSIVGEIKYLKAQNIVR